MSRDQILRDLLVNMLTEENAHAGPEQALHGLNPEDYGLHAKSFPYTIWQLLEHIRIAQWDIVEFSSNPEHVSPEWPEEYWPASSFPDNEKSIEKSLASIRADRKKMTDLIRNPANDLLEPFSWGTGQNLAREAILLIDHTSYHTGQIILLRKIMGTG